MFESSKTINQTCFYMQTKVTFTPQVLNPEGVHKITHGFHYTAAITMHPFSPNTPTRVKLTCRLGRSPHQTHTIQIMRPYSRLT